MFSRIKVVVKRWRGQFPKKIENGIVAPDVLFADVENVTLGEWVYIGPKSFIEAKGRVAIEDGAVLSSRVTILSSSHDYQSRESMPYGGQDMHRSVRLKEGCWIGYGALILPGVTVGVGGIVGAGAVVTKDVEDGEIVGGNPAKSVGRRQGSEWLSAIENKEFRVRKKLVGK